MSVSSRLLRLGFEENSHFAGKNGDGVHSCSTPLPDGLMTTGAAPMSPSSLVAAMHETSSAGGVVTEERRLGLVKGGGPLEADAREEPQAYIPCAICRAPIAIVNANDPLPSRLTCEACGTVLER
jgi:hypothetical protein